MLNWIVWNRTIFIKMDWYAMKSKPPTKHIYIYIYPHIDICTHTHTHIYIMKKWKTNKKNVGLYSCNGKECKISK